MNTDQKLVCPIQCQAFPIFLYLPNDTFRIAEKKSSESLSCHTSMNTTVSAKCFVEGLRY